MSTARQKRAQEVNWAKAMLVTAIGSIDRIIATEEKWRVNTVVLPTSVHDHLVLAKQHLQNALKGWNITMWNKR